MSHKPFDELRADLARGADLVDVGARYRHSKTGGFYIIDGLTILEATDEVAVKYHADDISGEDVEFTRSIDSFTDVVEIDGVPQPRFERDD